MRRLTDRLKRLEQAAQQQDDAPLQANWDALLAGDKEAWFIPGKLRVRDMFVRTPFRDPFEERIRRAAEPDATEETRP